MKKETKEKQIVVRFDKSSYDKINECARKEHRGLGEFVRHAVLVHIESYDQKNEVLFTQHHAGRTDYQPELGGKE